MAESQGVVSSGVQELIDRIRQEGRAAGEREAQQLFDEAQAKADALLRQTEAHCAQLRREAEAEIASQRTAALSALKAAARDTVLELVANIAADFDKHLRRLVTDATSDPAFVRSLVLVLAGTSVGELVGQDSPAAIALSAKLLGRDLSSESTAAADVAAKSLVHSIASDMLRQGVTLVGDVEIEGGVRLRLVKDDLEVDLTDTAISALLTSHLLPRFRHLLDGTGEG